MTPEERAALVERAVVTLTAAAVADQTTGPIFDRAVWSASARWWAEVAFDAWLPELEAGLRARRPLPEWFPTEERLKRWDRTNSGAIAAVAAIHWLLAERAGDQP